ncbi:MAG: hypothetical protein ILNGONEN_01753 [Syntrophorhabdaceae bacterium]|nr:hypothetical protein [Syntrophorhabdaceae bacterium]
MSETRSGLTTGILTSFSASPAAVKSIFHPKRLRCTMRKLFLILLVGSNLLAQPQFIASLYPTQHALNVPADAVLHVGLRTSLDPASLSDSSIYVWSDITGLHKLTVTLENGNKDLRIVLCHWRLNGRPPFNAGERVTVTLTTRLRYADGRPFEGFTWHYTVAVRQNRGGDFNPLATLTGGGTSYFYVSDFNGDGWCDLIGNDDGVQRKMIVFLNDGKGVLQFSHIENIISPSGGETMDIDRDGDQEVTYAGNYLIFNDSHANFIVKYFPGRPNGFAKAYDFNNDGIMDFAIGSFIPDTLYFGFSKNGESFKKLQKIISPIKGLLFYVHGLSYDLNNDGRIDFLYVGQTVAGTMAGGFASFEATAGDSMRKLQVLDVENGVDTFYGNDLNGDRYIDYAFGPGGGNQYIVFSNNSSGQLKPTSLQHSTFVSSVEGGDWDGDGDIDLAFAVSNLVSTFPERYAPDVAIFLNDGKGNFSLANRIHLPFDRSLSHMLRAVDLDRDGDLDLIGVANGLLYVVANGAYPNAVAQQPSSSTPMQFTIEPIYPNPVKNEAEIVVNLPDRQDEKVMVTIFDVNGHRIRQWQFNEFGRIIRLTWDIRDQSAYPVPSGVYFVQARLGKFTTVQKFSFLK